MSDVVTCVLKVAFGFISNKVRSYSAEKLQNGGLTDQKFRGLIVRELDDIKFRLDANARKDLLASISCLKQGVDRLHMSLDEFAESRNPWPSTSELPKDRKQSQDATTDETSSTQTNQAQKSATVEDALALANTIGKLKIVSSERFEIAKESFKMAGNEARRAFHNAALTTEERIVGSKVRIASAILEHLEDPEVAASDCLHYLQELHDMPEIQGIFSVHVKRGIKSLFKKDSRLEIVETVTMINLILADFISKFTKRRMGVLDWPMIVYGTQAVHPVHYEKESLPNLKEMEITPPWDMVALEEKLNRTSISALNQKGDVLLCNCKDGRGLQRLDKTTAKLHPYLRSPLKENTEHSEQRGREIIALTVDEYDKVYVLTCDEDISYTLSIYSQDGRNTHHCTLTFLQGLNIYKLSITVTKDKNIIICCDMYKDIIMYLCDSNGELIKSSHSGLTQHSLSSVLVSSSDEILLATGKGRVVSELNVLHTYTQQGQLQRTIQFRPSDGCTYRRICYDQVTKNIIGGHCNNDKVLIDCLSDETGELRRSCSLHLTNFPANSFNRFDFVCHTNGALALVCDKHAILLLKPFK